MKIQYEDTELLIVERALFRTTTTVINGASHILLVDPNWLPIEIEFIASWINKVGPNKIGNSQSCNIRITFPDQIFDFSFSVISLNTSNRINGVQ